MNQTVFLNRGKESIVKMRHPWIFSGALKGGKNCAEEGAVVSVKSENEETLGVGHFQQSSIAVRLLSFTDEAIDEGFYRKKLEAAWNNRLKCGFEYGDNNNCFRWVNGEGDGLPGLIIDRYGAMIVLQFHSVGMYLQRMEIAAAARSVFPGEIKAVYLMPTTAVHERVPSAEEGFISGDQNDGFPVSENGMRFLVHPNKGQKTGFFVDQRDNRALVKQLAKDKRVLNAFSYSGGFSIAALQGGAKKATSVDVSEYAAELCEQHLELNGYDSDSQPVIVSDVMKYLSKTEEAFDLIILDPPAFAKSRKKSHNAVQAYKRLNALAMKKIEEGGLIFTFSCSQVIHDKLFEDTVRAAAMEANRDIKLIRKLGPGIDHPVNIFHPEGHYLKGILLVVGDKLGG